jgi:hypothetical protein
VLSRGDRRLVARQSAARADAREAWRHGPGYEEQALQQTSPSGELGIAASQDKVARNALKQVEFDTESWSWVRPN